MYLDLNVEPWPDEWVDKVVSFWGLRLWGTVYHRYYALLDLFLSAWRSLQIKSYYSWSSAFIARPFSGLKKLVKGLASRDRALANLSRVLRGYEELLTPRSREFYRYMLPWFGHDYVLWGAGTIVAAACTNDTRWLHDAEIWAEIWGSKAEGPHVDLCPEDTMLVARQCILVAFARWGPIILQAAERGLGLQFAGDSLARDVLRCLESSGCAAPNISIEVRYPVRVVLSV